MELISDIKYLETKYKRIEQEACKLEECVREKDYNALVDICHAISSDLSKLSMAYKEMPYNYGIVKRNENKSIESPIVNIEKNIHIRMKGNATYISLEELLPHRPMFDYDKKKMSYDYNLPEWKSAYIKAFERAVDCKAFEKYKSKVLVTFIFHQNSYAADLDSFDIKGMLDIITLFFLQDDNPNQVCLFLNGVEEKSSKEYTEIIIKPCK